MIMLTANAIVGAKEEYMEAGFTDYLTKPIRETELLEMILKYLPTELICETNEQEKVEIEIDGLELEEQNDSVDVTQSETDTRTDVPETGKMGQLEKLEALDVKTGLTYCMNEEDFYVEMLGEYLRSDKVTDLERFFTDEDWDNYRTLVHALKSTSLTIGAVHLSGEAKALELAAKKGDADYIRSHHKAVMEEYMGLTDQLRKILL